MTSCPLFVILFVISSFMAAPVYPGIGIARKEVLFFPKVSNKTEKRRPRKIALLFPHLLEAMLLPQTRDFITFKLAMPLLSIFYF